MPNEPARPHRARTHSWIAVLINTFAGGVIGATFGSLGNLVPWLTGGLVLGALLGLVNEVLFHRVRCLGRWYKLRSVILVLAEALAVFYVVMPAYGVYDATHPARAAVVGSPAQLGMAYEDVAMPAAGGITLRGWYVPSHNGAAIIAVHGADANRDQMLWHAQALAEEGYGVLLFDLRAHEESDGTVFPVTDASADIAAAVHCLRARPEVDRERIGAVGLSRGAEVVLQAGAADDSLKATIAEGGSTNRISDMLPLPSEFRFMYVAAPMWWVSDRFADLMSGTRGRPLVEQVSEIAPRPVLLISSKEQPEPFMNRRLYEHAGPGAQL